MFAPTSREEFLKLLDDAIFETEELIECVEFDETAQFVPYMSAYKHLATGLRALKAALVTGDHELGKGKDFEFMNLVRENKRGIPFHHMLEVLNSVYKEGFK